MSNHPEELRIEFRKIITLGKGADAIEYTHVDLREPTAGELEKAQRADTPIGAVITLVAAIAGVPRLAVEKMSGRDINTANKYLSGFQDGPETAAAGPN